MPIIVGVLSPFVLFNFTVLLRLRNKGHVDLRAFYGILRVPSRQWIATLSAEWLFTSCYNRFVARDHIARPLMNNVENINRRHVRVLPPKLPLPTRVCRPLSNTIPSGLTSPQPKQLLNRFSHFCTAHGWSNGQTHCAASVRMSAYYAVYSDAV